MIDFLTFPAQILNFLHDLISEFLKSTSTIVFDRDAVMVHYQI